jgi:2-polyprenyl-6-methoxyphenol hydroxylase-like FAD-dependent oxidoreductase
MRVGVVGGGTGGATAALFLSRAGHDVEILERVPDPRPVGAGILLQPLGQRILGLLDLGDRLAARSSPIRHIEGRATSGRTVLDFGYADAKVDNVGLGVNRGELFGLLWDAMTAAGVRLRTGFEAVRPVIATGGWRVEAADGESAGPFDLVVVADGARSTIRRRLGLATTDVRYPYGAMWSVVPDPDGLAGDVLFQRYRDTRTTLGVLPTGIGQASIFWSARTREMEQLVRADPRPLVDRMVAIAGHKAPLVELIAERGLLGATYRDVVVPNPIVVDDVMGRAVGLVLIGDAAHAMSPQLGMGASLALADAWSLANELEQNGRLDAALHAYAIDRRSHIRWYTWLSRFMTPVFQSDLIPVGWARDLTFGPAAKLGLVRSQFAQILLGEQTSPLTRWAPTRPGGPLAG